MAAGREGNIIVRNYKSAVLSLSAGIKKEREEKRHAREISSHHVLSTRNAQDRRSQTNNLDVSIHSAPQYLYPCKETEFLIAFL